MKNLIIFFKKENWGIVKNENGEVLYHRTWRKVFLNPILRSFFKCSIVSCFDDEWNFIEYRIREYPKYCKVLSKKEKNK